MDIEERGVKVHLTIINTPGYGDSIDCTDNYKSVLNYIDNQFERYFNDENGLNRRNISDTRVHCLLYFISSLTRGFESDSEFSFLMNSLVCCLVLNHWI